MLLLCNLLHLIMHLLSIQQFKIGMQVMKKVSEEYITSSLKEENVEVRKAKSAGLKSKQDLRLHGNTQVAYYKEIIPLVSFIQLH